MKPKLMKDFYFEQEKRVLRPAKLNLSYSSATEREIVRSVRRETCDL